MTTDFATTDLCDQHGDDVRVAAPVFRSYGGRRRFAGPAATLRCFEDNTFVRTLLEQPGAGRVLVVDGGGSLRCALVGDQLAALGVKNAWAGIVVHGCVRDSVALAACDIGILALATNPRRSRKRNVGEPDVPVEFAGLAIRPGEWLYADEDGLLLAARRL
jgi:regulator of ribonuclease activity A